MNLPEESAITSPTGSPKVPAPPPPLPSPPLARSFTAQLPWVLRTWMFPSSSEDRTGFQGHEIEWSSLRDFFLSPSPSRDGTAADLGQTESTMNQSLAPRITWQLGDPNLEPQGRLVKTPLRQDREAYDPNEFPDFVVLSRQAFDGNSELASAWAQDHVDAEKDDFRNWEQVAAIGVLGGKKICQDPTLDSAWVYPATRVKHHLRKLAAESPIRSHTFGFTLDGSILTLYLHTPSGLFYSSDIECTESNGHLSMFITRLLSLNDLDLGKIASPGEPDGPPLPFPVATLPPRVPVFAHHLGDGSTIDSVEIAQTVFCSGAVLGLQTSASRVRATRMGVNGEQEYAMTVSFVEEARCDEHDRIRLLIASASPQEREGLTNFVDVHREVNFGLVPHFLKGQSDADSAALKPRAMEVAFQERCFETIWTVDSTEALIRVALGVVKGLRSLHRMRILHRDVSSGNIMVGPDGEGVLIDYDLAVLMDGPFGNAARLERVEPSHSEQDNSSTMSARFCISRGTTSSRSFTSSFSSFSRNPRGQAAACQKWPLRCGMIGTLNSGPTISKRALSKCGRAGGSCWSHIWTSGKAFLISLLLLRSTADSVCRFLLTVRSQKRNGSRKDGTRVSSLTTISMRIWTICFSRLSGGNRSDHNTCIMTDRSFNFV
ncbi:hypothetical protein MVLG_06715 [Microbotryum lychnidis-dioicae p1A1 Lamole]|uniref:Fungal-type protein kinase domain-containing protein n=1 Tax=Microbotryum lychnidis-dioicae (strain p1A1 Lamole / MvSl-1064) TaxID=683840 RepID=U5HI48_USTV1|nr:hypothetical protein MVLG_06715 [Microbotryum lychnidis-dioicae p1A1 Lamole]|eukprot:KDE02747.1 hypothetical protein MVLG_06715 [Microbotryum lychnidis-dioicae p1A1 Lamole]